MFNSISNKELQALKIIRKYILDYGQMPSVRELMRELNYKSPRSASVILQGFEEKGILKKRKDGTFQITEFEIPENFGTRAQTVKIPLLGNIACGLPIFAEENVEAHISVSVEMVKSGYKYFLLRAEGDSMDEAGINNGDLVLIKQQQFAENGDRVVALIDDTATIKIFKKNIDHILLVPKSSNKKHQPIILTKDFRIQGIVEAVIQV